MEPPPGRVTLESRMAAYAKAPITEATIEFRFQRPQGVSIESLNSMAGVVRETYPRSEFQAETTITSGGTSLPILSETRVVVSASGLRFRRSDQPYVVTLSGSAFALSRAY